MTLAAPVSRRLLPAAAAALLLLAVAGCGKKAPLRLPEQLKPEKAATPSARVREGRVRLDFRVPRHRLFPEREDPWVLARVLRRPAKSQEFLEVGTILKEDGFAFEAALFWSDGVFAPGSSLVYRIEFRDAARQRRALSEPLAVSWETMPGAPTGLIASGDDTAVRLSWEAPPAAGDAVRYRVYRRTNDQTEPLPLNPEATAPTRQVDTRVEAGRDYCYSVRAILGAAALEIEGPASDEICVRAQRPASPPPAP